MEYKLILRKLFGKTKTTPPAPKVLTKKEPCELKWGNNDKENQVIDCNVYKNGEFSHTVKVGYFTEKQIAEIEKAKEELRKEGFYC